MTTREQVEAELAAVFEELVDLIGEVKQAAWNAWPPERRRAFDDLRLFLAAQAGKVDDAELALGRRPDWVRSPTSHQVRNIASDTGGDPDKLVTVLTEDLNAAVGDIRRHAASLDGEPRELLDAVADALMRRIDEL